MLDQVTIIIMCINHVLGLFVHPGAMVYEDEHGVMYVNDDMSLYHVSGSFVHPEAVVYEDEHGVMYVNDDMSLSCFRIVCSPWSCGVQG